MTEQEILNSAAHEEWTHFTEDGNYLLNDDGHFFYWNDFSQEWASCRGIKLLEVRSRKDIQTIVDLRDKNAGLEKERDEANCHAYYILETCTVFSPKKLQAHNLEQRIEAFEFSLENIAKPEVIYNKCKQHKADLKTLNDGK